MKTTSEPYVLAIDVGTSTLKAVLYSAAGQRLAAAAERYTYNTPQPGWAEAEPEQWWQALVNALARLREGANLNRVQVIGLTGQMHTAVLLNRAGQPVPPTILWLDRRAAAETAELQQQLGLPPSQLNSTYTLPKLLWLARNRPDVLAQTQTILWPKDYLRYRLTGRRLTDLTEAGGAALLNYNRRAWAVDRLAMLNLSPEVLPPLRQPNNDAGPLQPAVARQLGLSAGAKVIVGAGDVIALLGAAPPRPGRMACSLGSSAMVACRLRDSQTIAPDEQRLYVYPLLPYRLLNGVLSTSGAALTWAKQALYGQDTAWETVIRAAGNAPPGADGLVFLPFLSGERSPYWSDSLRGAFYGLTLAHNRVHMVRAVLEGVAYSLRHLLDIAEALGVPIEEVALAGGGTAVDAWPPIIADVCRRPVLIYAGEDTVTRPLFAYCLAALEPSVSFNRALNSTFDEPTRIAPRPETARLYQSIYRRYRRLADFAATQMS